MDDPNFWQKWAKKAELDIDALNGRVSTKSHPGGCLIGPKVGMALTVFALSLEQPGYRHSESEEADPAIQRSERGRADGVLRPGKRLGRKALRKATAPPG